MTRLLFIIITALALGFTENSDNGKGGGVSITAPTPAPLYACLEKDGSVTISHVPCEKR